MICCNCGKDIMTQKGVLYHKDGYMYCDLFVRMDIAEYAPEWTACIYEESGPD